MSLLKRLPFLSLLTTVVATAGEVARVTPADAARRVAEGAAVLVDVREPSEWKETGVAAPAVLLPLSDFDGERKLWKPFLAANEGKELIVYCRSGRRSGAVAAKLAQEGRRVSNAGGFSGWQRAGLPVREP